MRESISYTFILNIVIVFIFTCFAVVMGLLSYYKAFRANSIIAETIEKYEGFNCISREEIARKLSNIGYKTPFNVDCDGKGDNCIADNDLGYVVTSYNLDMPNEKIVYNDETYLNYKSENETKKEYYPMNSSYLCNEKGCTTNKHYQYGIYTYMYVEMPVISKLLRLSFFSKTNTLYEFRNFYVERNEAANNTLYSDIESAPSSIFTKIKTYDDKLGKIFYVNESDEAKQVLKDAVSDYYNNVMTGGEATKPQEFITIRLSGTPYNRRINATIENLKYEVSANKWVIDKTTITDLSVIGIPRHKCGYVRDYTAF